MIKLKIIFLIVLSALLSGCGFHLKNNQVFSRLATPLYISATDPYSNTVDYLKMILKHSQQDVVDQSDQASYILEVLSDQTSQNLAGVSSTQVRSYTLYVGITAQLRTVSGTIIMPPTTFAESRSITTQSSSVMGNTAEIDSIYQIMRRAAINALLNRLNSKEIERLLRVSSSPRNQKP